MRKITFFILLALLVNITNAQITKGNWMLGGEVSYSSTDYNSENFSSVKSYYLKISPQAGFFFRDKLAAGVKAGINSEGVRVNNFTDFNIGPFVRYYFLSPENRVNLLAEGLYQYGFDKFSNANSVSKNTFSFSVGPAIYFNSVVGLEILASYSTYKFADIEGRNNTIMIGVGLQVHLEKE